MSWATPNAIVSKTFPFREGEDEFALKMRFAEICAANPHRKLMAGYTLFPGVENYGRAFQCQEWLSDPLVQEEIARLIGPEGAADLNPTRAELAQRALDRANPQSNVGDQLKAIELAAKILGYFSDGGASTSVNIQNVIQVPRRISNDQEREDFDREFETQQLKLVKDARKSD